MGSSSLKPRTQARGVIPEKVSDLKNDLSFVTREELDRITAIEGYSGLENSTARVEIDNTEKTIEVFCKTEKLEEKLPKDSSGMYIDGTYTLRATVVNGAPTLEWVKDSGSGDTPNIPDTPDEPITPYYYGLVTISSVEDLTADMVKNLTQDGVIKSNKEYKYISKKQRQVMAYPAKFGELSTIIHKETGFSVISSFEKIDLTIDGIEYYAYISYNSTTGTYTYIFNY